ncbi:DUF1102 domain-containing protein [Haloplanus ruber]|uniref:DUF1102 domain-containing protein n=1 Tax=Haloplanus ruber TaxID=869892 RepID=A0ABD6CZX6_9EURY|nr:DUF1102 domain-containing protein [Haloplanus ruber]
MIGTIGAGSAVVNGTGAFTSVEADRDVAVDVAADANAFLALEAVGPNAPYTETTDGQFGVDLTGDNATSAGGQGVNADATTVFEDLFEVRNQGTQEVDVEVTPLILVDTDTSSTLMVLTVPKTDFPSVALSPGTAETYSLVVAAFPDDVGSDVETGESVTVTGKVST